MRIVHYFINYNDSWYFPFIKKHYSYCERIVCLDNYSTDNSEEIAKECGFEFRRFGIEGELSDEEYLKVKNEVWKECRGKGIDYVIVSDADEFVCVPVIFSLYEFRSKLITAPIVIGYDMTSEELPINDIKEVSKGFFYSQYSKQAIFSPDYVQEINYRAGCHENNMKGKLTRDIYNPCLLLHYRCIGGVQRLIDRQNEYVSRMKNNGSNGSHYLKSEREKIEEWFERMSKAKVLW